MIVASGASITNPWKTLLMYQSKRCCLLLACLLSTVSAWGNCSDEERMEMQRLGLEESVIAYTCDEEIEIIMEAPSVPPPVIAEERPVLEQTVSHSIGHRQQVSIGVGVADGSYSKFGQDTSLNGTALAAQYHWLGSIGYTLGFQWLVIEIAGGASATDEIRYTQETLGLTAGWMWIDRPSLTLAPEIVIGIWGSGHLTDSIENARAQSSLNGLEVPISIQIDDALRVGAEYTLYDLSVFSLPESGIDISYPGSIGKARLEQSLRFYGTYRF